MAAEAPPRKETVAEFDNPLYSDTGPVTFSETTLYESVSVFSTGQLLEQIPLVSCVPAD